MSDGNKGARPISPHLTVWRWELGAIMSIVHRITGCAMALGAVLVVWWFLSVARGGDAFETVDGILTSWIGGLIMIGFIFALWFHFCNGIRHLIWDVGQGLEIEQAHKSGVIALAAAGALTVFTLVVM
jgi:succinate dehydrogenase cytochrome b subunit